MACNKRNESASLTVSTPESRAREACDGGDYAACYDLGALLDGAGKSAEARAVLEKACRAKNAKACGGLGKLLGHGRGGAADKPRARAMYQMGCEAGDLGACANLGFALMNGEGGPRDPAGAAQAWTKACPVERQGAECDPLGCKNRGVWATESVPPDYALAKAAFQRACDAGELDGCASLASLHANGWGMPKDPAKALALGTKACDGGSVQGCFLLGFMYANGAGTSKDPARARPLLDRACKGGEQAACAELKKL
jgi:TPR repeat protein